MDKVKLMCMIGIVGLVVVAVFVMASSYQAYGHSTILNITNGEARAYCANQTIKIPQTYGHLVIGMTGNYQTDCPNFAVNFCVAYTNQTNQGHWNMSWPVLCPTNSTVMPLPNGNPNEAITVTHS